MLRLKIIATEVRHGKYMTHVQTTYLFSLIDNRFNGCRSVVYKYVLQEIRSC